MFEEEGEVVKLPFGDRRGQDKVTTGQHRGGQHSWGLLQPHSVACL